jgi:hypothetical protein
VVSFFWNKAWKASNHKSTRCGFATLSKLNKDLVKRLKLHDLFVLFAQPSWGPVFVFGENFGHLAKIYIIQWGPHKGFLWKKYTKSHQSFSLKLPIFWKISSIRSAKYIRILKYSYFPLTCSQIWLIPLVDDCQYGYITKFKEKKNTLMRTCGVNYNDLHWIFPICSFEEKYDENMCKAYVT